MTKVLVYDEFENKMYRYDLDENDPMPFNIGRTLLLSEFRGSSRSNVLWTTKRAMEAWNVTRKAYGKNIYLGYAFKRIWEGGHGLQSQHYAGVSFDTMQTASRTERRELYELVKELNVWGFVEPIALTPTWVHFDRRYGRPACGTAGYPLVRRGSRGVYVLILQDALNALGFDTKGLDGMFGANTYEALVAYQKANSLGSDGIAGCNTWKKLSETVVGIGRTQTVTD